MTEVDPDGITGTITIAVLPQDNGQYVCQMSPSLSDSPRENLQFYETEYIPQLEETV